MATGKSIVLGVTGGIAAYKSCEVARALTNLEISTHVVMTEAACQFVTPLTFQTLTSNTAHTQMFDPVQEIQIGHISLARRGDLILIAPATADFIGKIAGGIADDLLTTVVMAAKVPVLIAPAMNVAMWENPIVQENISKLKSLGYQFIEPMSGPMACGEEGTGKLAEVDQILERVQSSLTEKILKGKKVLITSGPTREAVDPVRFLSNRSSGKMGYALAKIASRMGASVQLVSGPCHLAEPMNVEITCVESALDMLGAVKERINEADVFIGAAAVADFRPAEYVKQKIKKGDATNCIELEMTPDILTETIGLGSPIRVGFAAETQNLLKNATDKLERKHLDMICANDVSRADIGFDAGHNALTILFKDRDAMELSRAPKDKIAEQVLELVAGRVK